MKYRYIDGCFVREDNKGKRLHIDWDTAEDIARLAVEGYSAFYIQRKLELDIKLVTLKTFMKHFCNGNIINLDPRDFVNMSFYDKCKMKFERWLHE